MSDEKPRRRTHRPFYDPSSNFVDIEETEPAMDFVTGDLAERLHAFIRRRAAAGDPVRWRCLISEFGEPYGRDAHYAISYAVRQLVFERKVSIDERRIPEQILPAEDSKKRRRSPDFKFGRIQA